MNAYLVTLTVLFAIGAFGNALDLARRATPRASSTRVIVASMLLQSVLGVWALYLLWRHA